MDDRYPSPGPGNGDDVPNPPMPIPIPMPPGIVIQDDRNIVYPADVKRPDKPVRDNKNRNDDFYKVWDQFNRRGAQRGAKRWAPNKAAIPSLDIDVEGRPGHRVETSENGVVVKCQRAKDSYESAAATCKKKVRAIVQECTRLNQKYLDRTFHLPTMDTLFSLGATEPPTSFKGLQGAGSVKRVEDIYDDPEFFEDGPSAQDVRQGRAGDCWFLAALTALSGCPDLIEKICVDRDEKVGVYGFVFFRDGEWVSEVIDDRLCLLHDDDAMSKYKTEFLLKTAYDVDIRKTPLQLMVKEQDYTILHLEKEYRESLRCGSKALYFASCRSSNETWLPLLEKAYAKAHGDYQAIEGGFAGEGIEDLTGGIATYVRSENVLNKDRLWEELKQVNVNFLFGCGSRSGGDYDASDEEGFVRGHAYTVLEAREVTAPTKTDGKTKKRLDLARNRKKAETEESATKKVRLLRLHNPWGSTEWQGAWSDGSKEWTPEIMKELNHTFGDDGLFWIAYEDFLKYYPELDRIRLIGDDWYVAQQWASVNVPWNKQYLDTSFKLTVTKTGPVVIILNQPDPRYFQGLTGRYDYDLHFRLYKEGEYTYLLRSMEDSGSGRSCTAELDLEPGTYFVYIKVSATRSKDSYTATEVVKTYRDERREKLAMVGTSFDLAHSKGGLRDAEKANTQAAKAYAEGKVQKDQRTDRKYAKMNRDRERLKDKRAKDEIKRKRVAKRKAQDDRRSASRPRQSPSPDRGRRDVPETTEDSDKPIAKAEDLDKLTTDVKDISLTDPAEKTAPEFSGDNSKEEAVQPTTADVAEFTKASDDSATAEHAIVAQMSPSMVRTDPMLDLPTSPTSSRHAPAPFPRPAVITPPTIAVAPPQVTEERPSAARAPLTNGNTPVERAQDDLAVPEAPLPEEPQAEPRGRSRSRGPAAPVSPIGTSLPPPPRHIHLEDDTASLISSVDDNDFPWDPSIDGPFYGTLTSDDEDYEDDRDDTLFIDDPWNAVCVVGLRVCSERDDGLGIDVVYGDARVSEEEMGAGRRHSMSKVKRAR